MAKKHLEASHYWVVRIDFLRTYLSALYRSHLDFDIFLHIQQSGDSCLVFEIIHLQVPVLYKRFGRLSVDKHPNAAAQKILWALPTTRCQAYYRKIYVPHTPIALHIEN